VKKFNNNLLFYFLSGVLILFSFFFFPQKIQAFTDITENITSNTAWTINDSPYVLRNSINIDSGVTLTIEPGVVVKFEPGPSIYTGVAINVFGNLVANGESSNKIYFTSFYDDTIGGDTNEDNYCYEDFDEEGNSLGEVCYSFFEPSRYDWRGINFLNSNNNYLKNIVFKYANEIAFLDHSYVNLEDMEVLNSKEGFVVYESNLNANGVDCVDLVESCLVGYNNSNINWANSIVDSIESDGFVIFNSSSLNISDTSIKNINGNLNSGLVVFNDSSIFGNNLSFSDVSGYGADYLTIFNHSNILLNNSSMLNCPDSACLEIFDGSLYLNTPSGFNIENSFFLGGENNGIVVFGDSGINGEIHHSKIINFPNFSFNTFGNAEKNINAKNNWWGNISGPFHPELNPTGTAGIVANDIVFTPWCLEETCHTRNPVILIPGITGTYLLKDNPEKDEVWPNLLKLLLPGDDSFLNYLALEPDGTENSERPVLLGDIIRGSLGVHVFDSLIDELTLNDYGENTDLFVFPYDWRKGSAENAVALKNKIDSVLQATGREKIDLVVHSMGGLIAKKYIKDNEGKVDKIIFLGTPHLGAPKAFKELMYGDSMGFDIPGILVHILNPNRAKFISQNMPAVYELLPSEKYFLKNGNYVTNALDKNNPISLGYGETKSFMIEKGRNFAMFPLAQNLHEGVDDLTLLNTNTYNFIGCGSKTIGEITVKKKRSWIHLWLTWEDDFDLKYVNGDETVPITSADGVVTDNKYFAKKITHGSLPSGDGVKEGVVAILKGNALPSSPNILTDTSSCNVSGHTVSVHSPVELHIFDEAGNHTGPDINGDIEENVPGVQYDVIEGEKFTFLPDGINYKIVTKATDTGGYNFQIKNQDKNDNITNIYDWTLIPLKTTKAQGEIWIGPDYPESSYVVKIDEDGNGSIDKDFPAFYDGTILAEEASGFNLSYSSSGSTIKNQETIFVPENKKLNLDKDIFQENLSSEKKEITIAGNTSVQGEKLNKKPIVSLVAKAEDSGVKINTTWLIITGCGFIIAILVNRFLNRK